MKKISVPFQYKFSMAKNLISVPEGKGTRIQVVTGFLVEHNAVVRESQAECNVFENLMQNLGW